jgi:rod shape determining protein RodA
MIAVGIGTMLFCHTYINIGMCIGLAPVTGLPLPFVSYGGSFIFVGMMCMGILQSVYRNSIAER